jgi:DNA-binding CsgD family transcriptional regulator
VSGTALAVGFAGRRRMLSMMAFTLEMDDGSDKLDPWTWRAVALSMLSRSGEGLVVCDDRLAPLYCSRKALQLLGRLGMGPDRILPHGVVAVMRAQLTDNGDRTDRIRGPAGGGTIELQASLLRGVAPAHAILHLREDLLRDDDLYAILKERYAISLRGFQLAQLLRRGLTNREISAHLQLTESTVKIYLHQLYRACGVSRRTSLIALLDRLSR